MWFEHSFRVPAAEVKKAKAEKIKKEKKAKENELLVTEWD